MKKQIAKPPKQASNIFFLVPYFLATILAILLVADYYSSKHLSNITAPAATKKVAVAPYPEFTYFYEPYISAQSAIILDTQTRRVLYAKNKNIRFSTASTAKIMTAFVALDHFRPNDVLIVEDGVVEGTSVGFLKGEKLYFDDILYSMLLASGNDAAYVLARNYPGGKDAFVARMNAKAKTLHLTNTHFVDPAGLDDDGNYSTVWDLARLCAEAMENPTFARVVGTQQRFFTGIDGKAYEVFNLNKLLGSHGIIGVKTGQTIGAGGVLTTAKVENGRTLILVVMQSSDRFGDTLSLINLITNNLSFFVPHPQEEM